VTEDEQRGVRLGFNEPQGGQIGSKPTVPSSGCLLEPVQGLTQATNQVKVSRVGKARGLATEDCLGDSVVEEGIFHIELLNGSVLHRAESLVVVDSGALSETPKDPTGLIAIKGPVNTELVREDPLAGDNVGALRPGNQVPLLIRAPYSSSIAVRQWGSASAAQAEEGVGEEVTAERTRRSGTTRKPVLPRVIIRCGLSGGVTGTTTP
jgi:hypothetical protein